MDGGELLKHFSFLQWIAMSFLNLLTADNCLLCWKTEQVETIRFKDRKLRETKKRGKQIYLLEALLCVINNE